MNEAVRLFETGRARERDQDDPSGFACGPGAVGGQTAPGGHPVEDGAAVRQMAVRHAPTR